MIPTLSLEHELLREHPLVIACDEVGRGALAGPVSVGATVVDAAMLDACAGAIPEGLKDSKLVTERRRPELAARAAAWVTRSAVGTASPDEIDARGIIAALGTAAARALGELAAQGVDVGAAIVILDGSHDYITPQWQGPIAVRPVVKADRDCASASAASIIAKVARDTHMLELHEALPVYAWDRNKGYGSAAHREAIREHGVSEHHRRTWVATEVYQPAALFASP
ncbi:MAG: ribonuclease HII [Microbacteriaceae bacterium]|nr:ribonuclease HII [Microbacteriaceae bacterium]